MWGAAIAALGNMIGGSVKAIFGYKERKVDLSVVKETNDKDLQIAWWNYLQSQSDIIINRIIRPLTMCYFIGDFVWQRVMTGTYTLTTIIPYLKLGHWEIGPITNGAILAFIIVFLFPMRSIEKMFMRSSNGG